MLSATRRRWAVNQARADSAAKTSTKQARTKRDKVRKTWNPPGTSDGKLTTIRANRGPLEGTRRASLSFRAHRITAKARLRYALWR